MHNLLRTLVYNQQVSLTLADLTELAKEGARLHRLSQDATRVFAKTLGAMTFMSACLKNERGEISLAVKTNGTGGDIAVSGNHSLCIRGYIAEVNAVGDENAVLGDTGSLTIIRDDGYRMPFVGSCPLVDGEVDRSFEEYFTASEQLPTRIKTTIVFDENGEVAFCGVAVLQPLPFADEETLEKVDTAPLEEMLEDIRKVGVNACANKWFTVDESVWEERVARYKCNCSKAYVSRVLVSLGKTQTEEIIRDEGAVRVHCHYCNTDYEFKQEDADDIFNRA